MRVHLASLILLTPVHPWEWLQLVLWPVFMVLMSRLRARPRLRARRRLRLRPRLRLSLTILLMRSRFSPPLTTVVLLPHGVGRRARLCEPTLLAASASTASGHAHATPRLAAAPRWPGQGRGRAPCARGLAGGPAAAAEGAAAAAGGPSGLGGSGRGPCPAGRACFGVGRGGAG